MWLYLPAATLLLLTREMYAIFAFAVFVATLLGRCDWRDVATRWKRAALAAVPGIVMLSWTAYLAMHFHLSPIAARTDNPDLKSWPYYMMIRYLKINFRNGNWLELQLLAVTVFTMLVVTFVVVRNFRRLPLALVLTLPYLLMTTALGKAIWEGYGSHMRIAGASVIVGLLLTSVDNTILLRLMLALQAIAGVDQQAHLRVLQPSLMSPSLLREQPEMIAPLPPGVPDNPLLNDFRSAVEWVDAPDVCRREYHGAFDLVHRELMPITVAVTNQSEMTWRPGKGRIRCGSATGCSTRRARSTSRTAA